MDDAEALVAAETSADPDQFSFEVETCTCKSTCKTNRCPCKAAGRWCTPLCQCGSRKRGCQNKTSLVEAGILGNQQPYQQMLSELETFVSALDIERMKTLCLRLLEGRGGLSLAQSLLEEPPESSPPTTEVPWCTCGKCHIMPQAVENLCCGRSTCITTYEIFYTICLHPVNLRVALENSADYRADEVICSNRNLRKTAYRQFILWAHGKLGRQNRRVVPSCVVQAIRHHYPSPTGLYMGYREH